MKFYKRDPDRALSGMAELTLVQRGAYNSLLDLLYSRDGEVPDDDLRVAKMMTCHWRQWAKVKGELIALGKVWVEGGNLRAKRVQETIKEAADFAQEQRRKASDGWVKRKSRSENNVTPLPPGNASTPTATATPTDTTPPSGGRRAAARSTRWATDRKVLLPWLHDADEARRSHGLPEIDLGLEAEKFANFWAAKSGAQATKLDWRKTWINWALRAERARNGGKGPTAHDKFLNAAASIIREQFADGAASEGDGNDPAGPSGRPLLPP